MRRLLFIAALLLPQAALHAQDATAQSVANPATCAVWARETSFAQSVADHDAVAFAEYLHPDAVFVNGDGSSTRGADAIAADWAGIVAGKGIALHWYPDAVDVAADGVLALSRGPYWIENPAATDESKRYRKGRFISTWLRDADGQWHVVFDGGAGDAPVAASVDEITALRAARQSCPAP